MNIKKPYTISESEKNRIMGLHSKMVLNEESGMMCETCGKVHEGACGGTYETEELEEISAWANDYEDGTDDWKEEMGEEMLTDLNGGTYHVAEGGMVEPTLVRGDEITLLVLVESSEVLDLTEFQHQLYQVVYLKDGRC